LERLSSHVGESNEIALTPSDFTSIKEDAAHTRATWDPLQRELQQAVPGARDVAAATSTLLAKIAGAADARDATTCQNAARELKARYFDLLSLLARRA
jgi:hypothetical protein